MARRQIKREPIISSIGLDTPHAITVLRQDQPSVSEDTELDVDSAMTGVGQANQSPTKADTAPNAESESSSATVDSSSSNPRPSQGLERLGRGVKALVQAVQNLRHLGVEDLILPLPKIVVVGDQSTGKSSLIEGISEIKVPRKLGVCTRCPLEINLTESINNEDSWACVVSLYKKYMYDGSHGKAASRTTNSTGTGTNTRPEGATRKRPLGPWIPQEAEDFIFARITNKDDVAGLLEWAQFATLNPKDSYEDYIPGSTTFKANRSYQVKFSPNVVRLEISGPNLPNLSFYDLPGVINVSDVPEERYLVDLVKNLVQQYIQADNSINLLALPMTDDPANSSASKLIRDEKAEARTVGVLTKPDRVQKAESLDQWIQILAGQRFGLGHGYHIVKNNPDITVNHAIARAQECEFFAMDPWSTTLKQYESRFGTSQLQTFLSQQLTVQIRNSLPRIERQVQQKLAQIDARLHDLPRAPAGNLPLKILEKIVSFEAEIQKHFNGGDAKYTLPKQWHNLAERFRKLLAESRPVMTQTAMTAIARESKNSPLQQSPMPARRTNQSTTQAIEIDSATDGEAPQTPTPTTISIRSGKKRINGEMSQNSVKRLRMCDIPLFTPPETTEKCSYSKRFSLADVRSILQDGHVGIPNQIDPKATQSMIKDSVRVWEIPTQEFLESTLALCRNIVYGELQRTFAEWKNTLLQNRLMDICGSFLEQAMIEQRENVARFLRYEVQTPSTLNVEAITSASEKALAMLQSRRRENRVSNYLDQQDANVEKTPSRQSKSERSSKVTDAQIGSDPYSREVLAISHVKGYYECAYSRFVDNIYQAISCELFGKCRDELGSIIKQELRITEANAHDHCALLLAVNPDDERERRQLTKEQQKLQQAQLSLEGLAQTGID